MTSIEDPSSVVKYKWNNLIKINETLMYITVQM